MDKSDTFRCPMCADGHPVRRIRFVDYYPELPDEPGWRCAQCGTMWDEQGRQILGYRGRPQPKP
jgi:rubredoxin